MPVGIQSRCSEPAVYVWLVLAQVFLTVEGCVHFATAGVSDATPVIDVTQ